MRPIAAIMLFTASIITANADNILDSMPARSAEKLDGYNDPVTVEERMRSMPLHAIEGVWQLTGEGSVIAIEKMPQDVTTAGVPVYRMAVVRSSDISIQPGSVMGYVTPAAKKGQFDARIYTGRTDDHRMLTRPQKVMITLSDDGSRMVYHPYGFKLRFNWWRLLLPYMYRTLLTPMESTRGDADGCVRIFPQPSPPLNPVYL